MISKIVLAALFASSAVVTEASNQTMTVTFTYTINPVTAAPTLPPFVPTVTTTVVGPWDSSASSAAKSKSSASLESSSSGSLDSGSSLDSFASNKSDASGSSGSHMRIWQWLLLSICLCCCCLAIIGGLIAAIKSGKKKKSQRREPPRPQAMEPRQAEEAPGVAVLTESVSQGESTLHISNMNGFKPGQSVVIEEGAASEEVCQIDKLGSLKLWKPCKHPHPKWSPVAVTNRPPTADEPEREMLLPPMVPLLVPSYQPMPLPMTTSYVPQPTPTYTTMLPQTMQQTSMYAAAYAAPQTSVYAAAPQTSVYAAAPQTSMYAAASPSYVPQTSTYAAAPQSVYTAGGYGGYGGYSGGSVV